VPAQSIHVVTTYDAKTHFSQLLTLVEHEEQEIIVTRHDRPVAKIIPFPQDRTPRAPGAWKGKMAVPDGWDEFTEDDEKLWYGE
jgi:prevent-host-death family protein